MCFLHCIKSIKLRFFVKFSKIKWNEAIKYDGFSDHTEGIIAPILYCILKKQKKSKSIYIEKHVKLKTSKGPDASTSIDTETLAELNHNLRIISTSKF